MLRKPGETGREALAGDWRRAGVDSAPSSQRDVATDADYHCYGMNSVRLASVKVLHETRAAHANRRKKPSTGSLHLDLGAEGDPQGHNWWDTSLSAALVQFHG